MTHPFFPTEYRYKKVREEIAQTEKLIVDLYEKNNVHKKFKFFRFPYGRQSNIGLRVLKEGGYINPLNRKLPYWLWDCTIDDGHERTKKQLDQMIEDCVKNIPIRENPCVMLMHDQPINVKLQTFQKMYESVIRDGHIFMSNKQMHDFLKA